MQDALNHVDLAFIVDTTGSMGAFIATARKHMVDMLRAVTAGAGMPVDLRVGLVEYRDHPPQDSTFVSRVHPFEENLKKVQQVINRLQPVGGGDGPEAVYDGLRSAVNDLTWRPHSCRVAVLLGDAPPHGVGSPGDGFRAGCPCGLTQASVTALVEQKGITLYALALTVGLQSSFAPLATLTGGEFFDAQGNEVIAALRKLLGRELESANFDRRVLETYQEQPDLLLDEMCEQLSAPRGTISASLSRLARRGFLDLDAVPVTR